MRPALQIMAARAEGALLDLPWGLPLETWPEEIFAALPRGISRHVVRFVRIGERIVAIKEIGESVAKHEYELLRGLRRLGAPCVVPLAVVSGRTDASGQHLNPALLTEHLPYSLPYRALFGKYQRPETVRRLIDALSVLLVRLHLLGFFWGDVSLSNTLFRRDAGEFSAYLVDAETGELRRGLTPGRREYDIEVARTNIIGELMDLQAGGLLAEDYDTVEVGNTFAERYYDLWDELTEETRLLTNERWRVTERINRLNDLGFEVGELTMVTERDGYHLSIQPKVVDAGHYSRKIMRLTGMDVQENQARRLMNDIEQHRIALSSDAPLPVVAHDWMTTVYEPTINSIPPDLLGKLEPAEIFHQFLEHRWYISERAGHDIPMEEAVASFVEAVLRHQRDERSVLGSVRVSPVTGRGITVATPTGPSASTPTSASSPASASTPTEMSAASPAEGAGA
ncbi:MAG: DUF4032 domain-containing protein [Actinomycetaceae bacterium]|nr:DUF4032 domain-containing protein [Actinomycetaceae bacterium]